MEESNGGRGRSYCLQEKVMRGCSLEGSSDRRVIRQAVETRSLGFKSWLCHLVICDRGQVTKPLCAFVSSEKWDKGNTYLRVLGRIQWVNTYTVLKKPLVPSEYLMLLAIIVNGLPSQRFLTLGAWVGRRGPKCKNFLQCLYSSSLVML